MDRLIDWLIQLKPLPLQIHSLLKSGEVGVGSTACEVVDKGQVFANVSHWPATEEAVQQTLVST